MVLKLLVAAVSIVLVVPVGAAGAAMTAQDCVYWAASNPQHEPSEECRYALRNAEDLEALRRERDREFKSKLEAARESFDATSDELTAKDLALCEHQRWQKSFYQRCMKELHKVKAQERVRAWQRLEFELSREEERLRREAEAELVAKQEQRARDAEEVKKAAALEAEDERLAGIAAEGEREWAEVVQKRKALEDREGGPWNVERARKLDALSAKVGAFIEEKARSVNGAGEPVEDVSCVAGKRQALRSITAPMGSVLLLQLAEEQKNLAGREAHPLNCACVMGKDPWDSLKGAREKSLSYWGSCRPDAEELSEDRRKCLEILDWEQEQKDRDEVARRIEALERMPGYVNAVLDAYQLQELVDVTPREFAGTLVMCEARLKVNPDLDAATPISDKTREDWRNQAWAMNTFHLGEPVRYQVLEDAETGLPFVRVTQGMR